MKQLISFCAAFFLLVATVQAQSITVYHLLSDVANKTPTQAAMDTVPNTGVRTQTLLVTKIHQNASVQVQVKQLSGTAAGYVKLQVSYDNVNYANVDSARIYSTSAVQTKQFNVDGTRNKYYRITYTGVGTMSAQLKSALYVKK